MVQPFREVFCIDPRRWGDPAVKCGGTTSGTPSIEQPLHTAKAHSRSFLVLRLPPLLTTHQRFPPAAARPYDPLLRLLSLSLSLQMLHLRPAMVAMRLRSTAAAAAMTNAEVYSAVADHIAERVLLRPPLRRLIVRAFGSDDESWKTNFSHAPLNLVRAVLSSLFTLNACFVCIVTTLCTHFTRNIYIYLQMTLSCRIDSGAARRCWGGGIFRANCC